MCKTLDTLDRWEVQGAESVHLQASGVSLQFRQNQRLLSAGEAGVGAVLWESALVLAAHLGKMASWHPYTHWLPVTQVVGMCSAAVVAGVGLQFCKA